MSFEVISARKLLELSEKRGYIIIDLRAPEDYQKAHVRGAVNISYDDIEKGRYRLNKNMRIILYCERGASSFLAARILHGKGYHVYTVVGGYNAVKMAK